MLIFGIDSSSIGCSGYNNICAGVVGGTCSRSHVILESGTSFPNPAIPG